MPSIDQTGIIALVFSVGFFVTLGVAIQRYSTADEFGKFWGNVGSAITALLGAIVAYYFTKDSAAKQVEAAGAAKVAVVRENDELKAKVAQVNLQLGDAQKQLGEAHKSYAALEKVTSAFRGAPTSPDAFSEQRTGAPAAPAAAPR